MRSSFATSFVAAGLLALAGASSAFGATSVSSNWAGYAVHGSRARFTKVVGVWRQPSATCEPGRRAYSAYWVGLGGYSETSAALEQIGTEVDCNARGEVKASAWYELVPAASKTIHFRARPGDVIAASVVVHSHRVQLTLTNETVHRAFHRTLRAPTVDVTSADWIVEAPSDCINANVCQTLPLANFRTTSFSGAYAQTVGGHLGSISDSAWHDSEITLTPGGRRFVAAGANGVSAGEATPSALSPGGSAFTVTYSSVSVQPSVFQTARATSVRVGHLVHPGR